MCPHPSPLCKIKQNDGENVYFQTTTDTPSYYNAGPVGYDLSSYNFAPHYDTTQAGLNSLYGGVDAMDESGSGGGLMAAAILLNRKRNGSSEDMLDNDNHKSVTIITPLQLQCLRRNRPR